MLEFSLLLTTHVSRALNLNYGKIKTQRATYRPANKIMKTYNFSLVDECALFQIHDFITALRPIQNHFLVNFSVGYILREGYILTPKRIYAQTRNR